MFQPANHLPKIWLMTDKRNDPILERVIRTLPKGCGIIFRHYHLSKDARASRFATIQLLARKNRHLILLADHPELARKWGADGVHGRQWKRRETANLLHSAPVHDEREIRQAQYNGADIFFLSPAYATSSHPGARPLGKLRLRFLRNLCSDPVILLGGMNNRRFASSRHLNAHGWAAIDALS